MDALAVVTIVYSVAKGIVTWIEERAERDPTIRRISITVSQTQNILLPLQDSDHTIPVEPQTLDIVKGIGGTLKQIQEHLVVWQVQRPHRILAKLSPSRVTKQLKEDERQLGQQLIMLLASIAVVGFTENRKNSSAAPIENVISPTVRPILLSSIRNREVRDFWGGYVGAELPYIAGDEFCRRLGAWMGEILDGGTSTKLLLRLDEFSIGGVTLAALQSLVGTDSLRHIVQTFVQDSDASLQPVYPLQAKSWWPIKHKSPRIALPLLIWIDDNPENNSAEIGEAVERGINVIQLTSTALAKAWIESNSEFLRYNDNPSKIRFISDNQRAEFSTLYLNLSAGENILRYLRGRQLNVPVLIYAGRSVGHTTYVRDYDLAGSTSSYHVVMAYIKSLAQRKADDTEWLGFLGSS